MSQHPFTRHINGDTLDLSMQGLTDEDMFEIIRFLHQYPEIKKLNVALNHIGDQGLADFSERNQTIFSIDFSGNNISDYGIAIFAYRNLTVVHADFSQNRISDAGISNYATLNDICDHTRFSTIKYH